MNCLAITAATLHLASLHIPNHGYTGVNPGVGIETGCGIVAGIYRSSQSDGNGFKPIVYAGVAAQTKWRWPIGVSLVAAHGYESRRTGRNYAVVPMPTVWAMTPEFGRYRIAAGVMPAMGPAPTVIHFTIKARVG